jgi:hypothetical protein
MREKLHEIISELHHLLSIATPDDLREAGRLPGLSPHLVRSLEALAEERLFMPSGNQSGVVQRRKHSVSDSVRRGEQAQLAFASLGDKQEVEYLSRQILKAPKFPTKSAILEFARGYGIKLDERGKDSRSRVARKVAKQLLSLPEDMRKRIISLLREYQPSQTEGWVGVIRGSR